MFGDAYRTYNCFIDLNGDCEVDLVDFMIFGDNWRKTGYKEIKQE